MIRILPGTMLALGFAACATTPGGSPATQILGKWTCATTTEGMAVAGVFDYSADGGVRADAKMDADVQNMDVSITGDIVGTWEFLPDGRLKETITSLTVKSANMGGQAAPPSLIPTMIQPMVDQSVVGQTSTSTVAFTADTFVSTDEDGVATDCKR